MISAVLSALLLFAVGGSSALAATAGYAVLSHGGKRALMASIDVVSTDEGGRRPVAGFEFLGENAPQESVVTLELRGGAKVEIEYVYAATALEIAEKLRQGASIDISGCLTAETRVSTHPGPDQMSCRVETTELTFSCRGRLARIRNPQTRGNILATQTLGKYKEIRLPQDMDYFGEPRVESEPVCSEARRYGNHL